MLLDVAFCELWCYSPVQMCLELLLRYLKFARCICPTNQLLPSKGYRAHGLRVIITLLHMLFFLVLPPLSKILCFSLSTATLKLKLPCGAIELLILLSMRFMMQLSDVSCWQPHEDHGYHLLNEEHGDSIMCLFLFCSRHQNHIPFLTVSNFWLHILFLWINFLLDDGYMEVNIALRWWAYTRNANLGMDSVSSVKVRNRCIWIISVLMLEINACMVFLTYAENKWVVS